MPTADDDLIRQLRATFKVEAEEHLQAISSMLLELEKSPPPARAAEAVESVYRESHSLKGAARAVDLSDIEAICQVLESVFSTCKREHICPSPTAFDTLHEALDTISSLVAAPPTDLGQRPDDLIHRLSAMQWRSAPQERVAPPTPPPLPASPPPAGEGGAAAGGEAAEAGQNVEPEKNAALETVRISIDKLDSRLLQAEELLAAKGMVNRQATELGEIAGGFAQWQKQWSRIATDARAAPGALAVFLDWNSQYIRALQAQTSALAARAEQDRRSIGKQIDELLEDSKKLLMLPFSSLAALFPRLVRDLCRDQQKEAELVIAGGEVEIDKRILEEMKDALIHVLSNCIDHGVEKPAERTRLNKTPRAKITIAVSQVNGSKVQICVSDDGAGVDVEGVKNSAVRQGIVSQADARSLDDRAALLLIFHSDVSASPMVTSVSGRGLGMAIVKAKTDKLGGQISIDSKRHIGTTLRLTLPMTMATFRGILVTCADRTFLLPTSDVERVLRVKPAEIRTVENRETISLQGRAVAMARLDQVLDLPRKPKSAEEPATVAVVVLRWADQRIAFAVDEVLHEEEVLVKAFGKPLLRVRNIAGAAVLASGRAVPVLNVSDLMKTSRQAGGPPLQPVLTAEQSPAAAKKILVVEDSITSRMLLKGILESAGYLVKTAVDGMDAFTALRENQFDLVVSDVEMPRMNGFDLTSRIRADKRLADLPVVLVTALESREERERGVDAGASAYIIKSSFDQSDLLEVVGRLI